MTTDFNTEPYNDDFSEDNKFYRILFRPGYAVQARELTQLQTILQDQITKQGNHIFKQGAMVLPGQIFINNSPYVKLKSSYGGVNTANFIDDLLDTVVVGSSGLRALITHIEDGTSTDYLTIYVQYLNAATNDNVTTVFGDDEVITSADAVYNFQTIANVTPGTAAATGTGSVAIIQRGIYFINGFFVLCSHETTGLHQTLVLEKYTTVSSYRVGLTIVETNIFSDTDETLLDNAQGTYNYAAPGANRYHIELTLSKKTLNDTDDKDFIELVRIDAGIIQRLVNRTEYSELEKSFARRTFDESGNYVVKPFILDVREARTNDRGAWTSVSAAYKVGDVVSYSSNYYTARNTASSGTTIPPVHTSGNAYDGSSSTGVQWEYSANPSYNRGISLSGSDDQLAIALDAGKAYVQGYEIEKVSTEYVYIDKCRDSGHQIQADNINIPATVGNYIIVNSIQGVPAVDTFDSVDLYSRITQEPSATLSGTVSITSAGTALTGTSTAFTTELIIGSKIYNASGVLISTVTAIASDTAATTTAATATMSGVSAKKDGRGIAATSYTYGTAGVKVGTARIRAINYDNGTVGTDASTYKLMLFDIAMVSGYDFNQNVKSIHYNNSAGGFKIDFSADIEPILTRLVGSVTASSTTVTGTGTSFLTDLVVGDYVYLGTTIRRITAIASQNSVTVDATITVTGVTCDRITTKIQEQNNETLIFQFPYYAIKSATGSDNTKQITYYTYQKIGPTTTSAGSGGFCTLSVTGVGNLASAAETGNYQVINYSTGKTVLVSASNTAVSGSSVVFTLVDTYASTQFMVIATSVKTLSSTTEKSKTLTTATAVFTTKAAATASILSLGFADGYRIISIKKATGFAFGSSPSSGDYVGDVSDQYTFDDGQTTSYYGLAKAILKPSYSPPNAPITVTFEYFAHGTGDYFTVNSYSTIDYKKIPYYKNIPLRDCIDFRSRMDTTGIAFSGSDYSRSLVLKRGYDIQADFSYYIGRADKIALTSDGNFFSITGSPALNPALPANLSLAMNLYDLILEPYTFSTKSENVNIIKYNNKRYTMRDIGLLENRINTLEYYTSLSMLELETQSFEVIDSATGLNRFKNGFIVDNFSGHSVGDVDSIDYFCSIDMEKNELRPFYSMKNVNLLEKESTNGGRSSANYQLTGDIITLPFTHLELVDQPYASRLENVNPFAIFTFLGNVNLNPSSDEWFETERRPDIIQNVDGDFNTVLALAESSGVLGTVWNAWQTQWTGSAVLLGSNTTSNRNSTTRIDTFATQIGLSRTGINTQVVSRVDTRLIDDKVVSTAVIPYIRSRNILIQASGLKPSTTFNAFFDTIDISEYCTPATKITYTGAVNFNSTTNVGGNAIVAGRLISGDTQVCLNRGDVITGGTSSATAVVIGTDKTLNDAGTVTARAIYVANIIGTFVTGETITGSVSAVSATVVTVSATAIAGDPIISNLNGKVQLLFNIPETDDMRFRAGQRKFILSDATTSASFSYTSRGTADYYAQGILENKVATFESVRNAELVTERVAENNTIIQISQNTTSTTIRWGDPLAQTFLIESTGGAFLTKVDIFFASRDTSIPVTLEIREVINGYPGKYVLPFSKVTLNPEDVNISTSLVTMPDETEAYSYDTATTFTFPSPVYTNDGGEYALVLTSDSNNYKVWISNLGDAIPGSDRTISEQPYAGVLFKSQNASTWTANQEQDLKFKIYRAVFDTTVVSAVEFINDLIPTQTLDKDPFETNTGSAKLKIYQNNHGFVPTSVVTISNSTASTYQGVAPTSGTLVCSTASTTVTGTSTVFNTDIGTTTTGKGTVLRRSSDNALIGVVASVTNNTTLVLEANAAITISSTAAFKIVSSINGIPSTEVYKQQTVSVVVDNDSYIVLCTTPATNLGYYGGSTVIAKQNVAYNAIQPSIEFQNFSDTTATFSIKTTSGKSVNGSETAHVIDSTYSNVIPNETNYFNTARLICSKENETALLSGATSTKINVAMSTTNDAISPVIDTNRTSLIAISNKINSPSQSVTNNSGIDDISLTSANVYVAFTSVTNAAVMSSANSATLALFRTIQVGKYITISGAAQAANNGTFLVTLVNALTGFVTLYNTGTTESAASSVTIIIKNTFIDEISPYGSSTQSKYVTKKINLLTSATTLKIKFAANVSSSANLQVYYKVATVGNKDAYSTINYTLVSPDSTLLKSGYGENTFTDTEYTLTDLAPFNAFTIKLVMTSTSSSEIPKVKDFRVVACS